MFFYPTIGEKWCPSVGKSNYPLVGLWFFTQLLGKSGAHLLVKTLTQRVLGIFYPEPWLFNIYPTFDKMFGKKLPNSVYTVYVCIHVSKVNDMLSPRFVFIF